MEIRVAKTAGFCFGVNRAVELTYGLLAEGHRVATLGPLIHNPQAVEDMQRKGAQVVDTVQDVPAGTEATRTEATYGEAKRPAPKHLRRSDLCGNICAETSAAAVRRRPTATETRIRHPRKKRPLPRILRT